MILESRPGMLLVEEAATGRQAVELARKLRPDVVVMDIGMTDLNGVEATRQILSDNPNVRVVALSAHGDRHYVLSMLDAGARAYVLKDNAAMELVRAIEAAMQGKTYLTAEVTDAVVDSYTRRLYPSQASAFSILGGREREVLQLIAEGLSSVEASTKLHISSRTVDSHRRNIMKKLDIHSVAELTKYALREGITQLDD